MKKRFLIRHIGNMGDMVFFVPPVLETLKKVYPASHLTFVTAWGYKEHLWQLTWRGVKRVEKWGRRNQGGFSIHLMMTNPHIDQLVHWHDTVTSLTGEMCREEGYSFPTWSAAYYQQQKQSGNYDGVYELDFGISAVDNPIQRMYEAVGLPEETYSNYQIYLTNADKAVAESVLRSYPKPRIVLLEGIEGTTTRGWDPGKVSALEQAIKREYGVEPIWFGGTYTPFFEGRPLTLRENIATLAFCDVGIGVMSGPMHFAAAVGLPTITLFCDQPLHRAAPAYFLNQYRKNSKELHRTLLGPTNPNMKFLKEGTTQANLTPEEWKSQRYRNWTSPGRQATKSCLAVITVDEVMMVLREALAS